MKKLWLSAFLGVTAAAALFSSTALAAEGVSLGRNNFRPMIEQVAADANALAGGLTPARSSNAGAHNYAGNWQTPVKSYFYANEGGGLTRVEYVGNKVIVEDYDSLCHLLAQTELEAELPLWGGFYAGKDSNFLVFGQRNREENNQTEVIRVVKYTKNWTREGAASLYGANTTVPFDAGSLSMAEYGNVLYIRTCHEMYAKKDDGLNHQANLSLSIDTSTMKILGQMSIIANSDCGYVSHSFNQFIAVDGNRLVAVDHGDAHPRSIALFRYYPNAGGRIFTNDYEDNCDLVNVLPIKGSNGANYTGAAIGGFEVSGTSYLIAGNSVAQDDTFGSQNQRNIFVSSTSKNRFSASGTTIHWITNYTDAEKVTLSPPHLVKIFDDRFLLLYAEGQQVKYVFLDGEGKMTSPIYSMEAFLSDCKPVAYQGVVVWYYTRNSEPVFCVIDGEGNGFKLNP